MLRIDTQKLLQSLKEVGPGKQEELNMLQFFFDLENGDFTLSSFKAKTLENILEDYYNRKGHVFKESLSRFFRAQNVLKNAKRKAVADGFV